MAASLSFAKKPIASFFEDDELITSSGWSTAPTINQAKPSVTTYVQSPVKDLGTHKIQTVNPKPSIREYIDSGITQHRPFNQGPRITVIGPVPKAQPTGGVQMPGGGAMGGMGGGGGGMGGYLGQLASMLGQQMGQQGGAPKTQKPPEKKKTHDELYPNGSPSGPNYRDPRLDSPSWIGGANLFDDASGGQNFTSQMAARPKPATPAPAPTPVPKPTTPKPTTPKPSKPSKPRGRWW